MLATIAGVAFGDSSSAPMCVYQVSGSIRPNYSIWGGSSWSSTAQAPNTGEQPVWLVARNCPTRDETMVACSDWQNDINIVGSSGATWPLQAEVTTECGGTNTRMFDIAYCQLTGKMVFVYWDGSDSKLKFRTYDGSSLSSPTTIVTSSGNAVNWVSLAAKPNSNEIMMIRLHSNSRLYATVYDGTSWGSDTTLTNSARTSSYECFAGTYCSLSGLGIVTYCESTSQQPRYRTRSGSGFSSEGSLPTIGGDGYWIRMAADPTSNQVLLAAGDSSQNLNVNVWDGSSWGTDTELETNICWTSQRAFDVAYEVGGTKALIVYADNWTSKVRYRTWDGSAWSGENWSSDISTVPVILQLTTGRSGSEIFLAMHRDGGAEMSAVWSNSAFSTFTTLSGSITAWGKECFMIACPRAATVTPANIPYDNDFESTLGTEWTDSTVTSNATYTKFLGRYRATGSELALNTTPGTRYTVTFDLYTIDSWNGSAKTSGPDVFKVSVDGSDVLSNTFLHDPGSMSSGCTYPHPADQYGDYGFNASYSDGIFRTVEVPFIATSSITHIKFSAALVDEGGNGFNDESWGIDNIHVKKAIFVDVSSAAGVNVQTASSVQEGSGLFWADLDNDGDLDSIVTGDNRSRLMLNNLAAGTFTVSNFGGGGVREQGGLADYDNDGDLDFWSVEAGKDGTHALFTNDGAASFTNAGSSGFTLAGTSTGCSAADINRDGWPDMVDFSDNANWIVLNQKSGSATFSSTKAGSNSLNGASDFGARGYCASGDINQDGFPDFFYRYNSGRLFLSTGDGTYAQNAHGISVLTGGYEDTASALGDYDNDGDLDLFVPRSTAGYSGSLWRNDVDWTTGTGNFTDVSSSKGLTLNAKPAYASNTGTRSGCWGDYDNDGDLDLFIVGSNGNSMLYRNDGGGVLTRTGEGAVVNASALDAVFVDYDNDGDLDLAVTTRSSTLVLFQNQTNYSNYLKVRLAGRGDGKTNTTGQGVRIELWNAAGTARLARRDIGVARGYGGAEPMWAHFGGVNPATAYTLKVYFDGQPVTAPYSVSVTPSAASTTIGLTVIPQMVTVTEPEGKKKVLMWAEVKS